jgi:hypothetical protein
MAAGVAESIRGFGWSRTEIPFRFGDIKLFVCRKKADVPARSTLRELSRLAASENAAE